MDSGILILILIFFFAFLSFGVGVYCHFCGESGSGGRYYGSNQNIAAAAAVFTARAARANDPTANNCDCRREFKGRCDSCEGQTFVDDGELGSPTDFSKFGGDQGFNYPGARGASSGGAEDPIRGLLGNGTVPTSALDQPDRIIPYGGGGV